MVDNLLKDLRHHYIMNPISNGPKPALTQNAIAKPVSGKSDARSEFAAQLARIRAQSTIANTFVANAAETKTEAPAVAQKSTMQSVIPQISVPNEKPTSNIRQGMILDIRV